MKTKESEELKKDCYRIIKISREALFEFLYESFIDNQEYFMDVDLKAVSTHFDIDFENGSFIACAYRTEDGEGNICGLPENVDMQLLLKKLPDTTKSLYSEKSRYKDFTGEELLKIQKA